MCVLQSTKHVDFLTSSNSEISPSPLGSCMHSKAWSLDQWPPSTQKDVVGERKPTYDGLVKVSLYSTVHWH